MLKRKKYKANIKNKNNNPIYQEINHKKIGKAEILYFLSENLNSKCKNSHSKERLYNNSYHNIDFNISDSHRIH